jgi:hypothetical protein
MKAVLEVIKKNILSIVCLLVAILAIVAVYVWPLPGKQTELQATLESRKTELDSLDSLAKKVRKLPMTSPEETTAQELKVFPTEKVIAAGNQAVALMTNEGKAVGELAAQLNEHKLLLPESLPAPTEPVAYEYAQAYAKVMDLAQADLGETLAMKALHAGILPTKDQIDAEEARREKELKENELVVGVNDKQITDRIARMKLRLADDLRAEIASRSQIWMEIGALDVYPGLIGATKPPLAPVIYYSQIGLWVQQDICSALAAANASADGVASASVKHLLKLEVTETGAGSAASADGTPAKVNTLSGRSNNDKYEVIPFRLIILVDATKVPQVLTELARNKFLTVNKCDLATVDIGSQLAAGYYYGDSPAVVQLTIDGEELLLKSWLSKYVPPNLTATPGTTPPG